MKKFLPILVIFTLIAFLFTGCGTQNEAPVITSPSTATTVVGNPFLFNVVATDPDGDTLTYEVSGPTGMVISEEGAISGWTPAATGSETATVTVSDGKNDPVTQTLTITVITAEETLDIEISVGNEIEGTAGKTYIPGGKQDINVKFKEAYPLGDTPLVKVGSHVVPVFSADRKNWSGSYDFNVDGPEMITVGGLCAEDVCASKPVIVDGTGPFANIKASVEECDCYEGYQLVLESDWLEEGTCAPEGEGCCGDAATGLASWSVKVYDEDPWDECCDPDPCIEPICEDEGEECPVSLTCDCIDEVFAPNGDGAGEWVDFFDRDYWVILNLTDEVGNETAYYGWLETDGETDTLVRFVELVIDPTNPDCWCFGEDVAAADLTLGDCDGTPAEVCYADPLNICPVVTVEPAEPVVGQEATITIDYTEAVAPDCPAAYVGPSIKTLPLGIPEDAQELVLTDNGDDTYTATYTFGQEGTDYIYVTDACGDCSPCKTGITVLPADESVCPDVEFLGEPYMVEDVPYYGLEDIDFEVTFAEPVEKELVKVYVGIPGLVPFGMPIVMPPTAVQLQMSTDDEMTYAGTVKLGQLIDSIESAMEDNVDVGQEIGDFLAELFGSSCIPMKIYVLAGDPCCIQVCEYPFGIDPVGPCVELQAEVKCCGGDCATGSEIWLTGGGIDCTELFCGDTCTELANWTIEVYDTQPFTAGTCGGCEVDPCLTPVNDPCTDEGCPVACNVFGCVMTPEEATEIETIGTYYVILTAEDAVGNESVTYGVLDVSDFCNPYLTCGIVDDPCECIINDSTEQYMQCGGCCGLEIDDPCTTQPNGDTGGNPVCPDCTP